MTNLSQRRLNEIRAILADPALLAIAEIHTSVRHAVTAAQELLADAICERDMLHRYEGMALTDGTIRVVARGSGPALGPTLAELVDQAIQREVQIMTGGITTQ